MIGNDKTMLSPIFKSFLLLLNTRQVEYLLVGGYAVQYYGYCLKHLKLLKLEGHRDKDLIDLEHLP